MKKYESYIWDFDGTLFESYKRMSLAFWKALQNYANQQKTIIKVSQEEIRHHMKESVGHAWRYYRDTYHLPEQVIKEYQELEQYMEEEPFQPFPQTQEVLERLRQQGSRHFVYTHRGLDAVTYLKKFELEEFFTGMITGADDFPAKPAPDALLFLIRTYQMKPEEVIMIGDRRIDVQAAQNAGIDGCLFDPYHEIADCACTAHIQSLKELMVI